MPSRPSAAESRITWSSGCPSGIACAAFTMRFTNTCPRRPSLPRTGGTSATSHTSRARGRTSFEARFAAFSRSLRTSTGPPAESSARAIVRRSRTMTRIRSAPSSASSSAWIASSQPSASAGAPRSRRSPSATSSTFERTKVSGLLSSCATPAASVPIAASRCARASRSCACVRSVRSRPIATRTGRPPMSIEMARNSAVTRLPSRARSRSCHGGIGASPIRYGAIASPSAGWSQSSALEPSTSSGESCRTARIAGFA